MILIQAFYEWQIDESYFLPCRRCTDIDWGCNLMNRKRFVKFYGDC